MRLLRLISNRVFITTILLIGQITWFILFLIKLTRYSVIISAIFSLLSLIMVLHIVVKDDNPSYKIAWIILIMALPLFGGLFYLFFGSKRPSKGMRILLDKEHQKVISMLEIDDEILEEIGTQDHRLMGTFKYLQEKNNFPLYKNTESTYYSSGETMFKDMLTELKKAKKYIFLEYFIIEEGKMWGEILKILVEKVNEGVDVRLIYDDVGSLFSLPKDFKKQMEDMGIRCMAFNKFRPFPSLVMNNRNHRKMLVIDGYSAFTGAFL